MRLVLCFIFLTLFTPAFALDFSTLSEIVSNNSPILRAKRIDLKAKELDVKRQMLDFLPDLSMRYSGNIAIPSLPAEESSSVSYSHSLKLSSTWNAFENADKFFDKKKIDMEYSNQVSSYEDAFETELYKAVIKYIDVVEKEMRYKTSLSNKQLAQLNLTYIQKRKEQGAASEIDILNAESEYDNQLYALASDKISYERAVSDFKRLLKIEEVSVSPPNLSLPNKIEVESLLSQYPLEDNPEIGRMKRSLEIMEIDKKLSFRDRFIPSVNIGASVNWLSLPYSSLLEDNSGEFLDSSISFSVSYPIFERNTLLNRLKKQRLQIEKQTEAIEQNKEDYYYLVKQIAEDYNSKQALLQVAERRRESSKRNYMRLKESYALGGASLLALYEAEQKYRETEDDFISLSFSLIRLIAEVGYSLGDTLLFLRE